MGRRFAGKGSNLLSAWRSQGEMIKDLSDRRRGIPQSRLLSLMLRLRQC